VISIIPAQRPTLLIFHYWQQTNKQIHKHFLADFPDHMTPKRTTIIRGSNHLLEHCKTPIASKFERFFVRKTN
jgi:hypothetical protein